MYINVLTSDFAVPRNVTIRKINVKSMKLWKSSKQPNN